MTDIDKVLAQQKNTAQPAAPVSIGNPYDYATTLLSQGKPPGQIKEMLVLAGVEQNKANEVVDTLVKEKRENERAPKSGGGTKDMVVGALWCIGGTIMTIADVGYIFWGAIVFGVIQFIGGAMKNR